MLSAPLTAGADSDAETTISQSLLDAAQAAPSSNFSVIVQGDAGTEAVAAEVESTAEEEGEPTEAPAVEDTFVTVPGVSATLTGSEVVALSESSEPLVITLDTSMTAADLPTNTALPIHAIDMPTATSCRAAIRFDTRAMSVRFTRLIRENIGRA